MAKFQWTCVFCFLSHPTVVLLNAKWIQFDYFFFFVHELLIKTDIVLMTWTFMEIWKLIGIKRSQAVFIISAFSVHHFKRQTQTPYTHTIARLHIHQRRQRGGCMRAFGTMAFSIPRAYAIWLVFARMWIYCDFFCWVQMTSSTINHIYCPIFHFQLIWVEVIVCGCTNEQSIGSLNVISIDFFRFGGRKTRFMYIKWFRFFFVCVSFHKRIHEREHIPSAR